MKDSLKILAIGNSFSVDSMAYLCRILLEGGVRSVTLGNLYYGGCMLEQHLDFGTNDKPEYRYDKTTDGEWEMSHGFTLEKGIADEDWDIITLQESSRCCGIASVFQEYLRPLVDYVRSKNATAELIWHMTWAYQQDSDHYCFPKYQNDQMTMYRMTVDCVRDFVLTDGRFSDVIPVGTSVQNARTSKIGDVWTCDGFHLNKTFGRYLAGICWAAKLTGADASCFTGYNPCPDEIPEETVRIIEESVNNACKTPYDVTESIYKG